jgi:anti-sigma regulatory factor (Ser/Thr protein kinase)
MAFGTDGRGREAVRSFVHEALLYRDPIDYLTGTLPYVRAALAAHEPVLVAVPGPRIELLVAALGAEAAGVRFLDMTLVGRNPGRIIPWVLHGFLEEHTGNSVRIVGEPVWPGRSAEEYPACVQHEALVNLAFAGTACGILCPYDVGLLPGSALTDAARTHPVLVDGDVRKDSDAYTDPEAVVAAYNRPLPEPAPHAAVLEFDASRLAGVRAFVARHAGEAGLPGHRVGDLQLAANELATNAVTHGGGTGWLRVWQERGRLVCEVRDRGGTDTRLSGRVPPTLDSQHGRGLVLVNYVSDLVRIHTGPNGTTVRVYVDL